MSSNIYRTNDAPLYHQGNDVLIALDVLAIVLFVGAKLYYLRRNKIRARRWGAMTDAQKDEYLATTTDEGNKRLDFQFKH